jgi:hypothetical protein
MSKYKTDLIDATPWNFPRGGSRSWKPQITINPTWDYCMVPTERPLYAILADVVHHGVDNPKHGTDCACLDKYIYELRAHVTRALPEMGEDSESRQAYFAAGFRIAHVLRCITRHL